MRHLMHISPYSGRTMPLLLRTPLHRATIHVFSAATQSRHISSVNIPASLTPRFPTQTLMACAPYLRTYRIPPLRSGNALMQALLCNPCPLSPRFPSLPIYFFSKFSFPCGSIRSLKSAFIIEGLSVPGEQVSPCNTKTRFAAFCITGLT